MKGTKSKVQSPKSKVPRLQVPRLRFSVFGNWALPSVVGLLAPLAFSPLPQMARTLTRFLPFVLRMPS